MYLDDTQLRFSKDTRIYERSVKQVMDVLNKLEEHIL
jgi:hypothetical protein